MLKFPLWATEVRQLLEASSLAPLREHLKKPSEGSRHRY